MIYFRFHRPTRGVSSGGTTCSLCLVQYAIMFIELCFNFMSVFAHLSFMRSITLFPISPLVRVVQSYHCTGLLEVPAPYLGCVGYFLARGLLLLNGYSSERLMLMGGLECAAFLA
jgi:hypothetical protein